MARLISVVAVALLCNSLFAQIELQVKPVTVIANVESPELFGSQLLVGEKSQPTKQNALLITASGEYQSIEVEAETKPNFDFADLIRAPNRPNDWLLIGAGKFRISAYAYDPKKGQARKRIDVDLGPHPDSDPDPGPSPDPPKPIDLPIEGEGLRVLVVYESGALSKLPESQKSILYSTTVRKYLTSKCPQENGSYEFRFFDQDTDLGFTSERWKKAMARPRESIPWVLIANGKEGFSGPLPQNVGEMMELLKKYGGQ